MALELYRKKRNFKNTPEPAGAPIRRRSRDLGFVIQKHAASHLHYDFRLELNGVLLSWAVPKGPSLDPNDKRLAMHVEDHPIEYGGFEGIIPPRQYGSGTVLLWDRGTWLPKDDPEEGYRKGKLKFTLEGEKLHGGWTLVKSHGGKYGKEGNAWLLIKEDDDYAQPAREASVVEEHPLSVASGRSLEEIAADKDRVWHSNKTVAENVREGAVARRAEGDAAAEAGKVKGAQRKSLPEFVEPQLATLVSEAPTGGGWIHEMKLDGYRILARIEAGEARLYSRNGKEWTSRFPDVAKAAARLPLDTAWLDGEVVVLRPDGRSSFQALQNALSGAAEEMYYYVFDMPYADGYDLCKATLLDRKSLLRTVVGRAPDPLRYSEHAQVPGATYYEEACKLNLEGIICKRSDAPYQGGRGRSWVKVKCEMRQEFVIGGYTDPEGSRTGFGALLLGVQEGGKLRYCGKVGTGFNEATLKAVKKKLDTRLQDGPPFANPPRGAEARRAHWVKPELVAEVRFAEWTNDGTLRHPSFQGLREDKKPSEIVRERAADAAKPEDGAAAEDTGKTRKSSAKKRAAVAAAEKAGDVVAGIPLTNAKKVLYPEDGITKHDLACYYHAVADWILPHLEDRPLTLVRCPNGWDKQCFYQKNADETVDAAIERVRVTTSEGPARYMMANSLAALVALVQMGALELHPWGSRRPRLGCPDRIIFDFDPDDDLGWNEIVDAVKVIKTLLAEIGLAGYLKTTGGKGLHVVVPVKPRLGWDDVKGFSKSVAELMVRAFPDRYTDKVSKSRRRGKIFIDYLRNGEGATAISAYAVRGRAHAPVAVPVAWEELAEDIRFGHFNIRNVPQRLKRMKKDPWAGFFDDAQTVTAAMLKKVGHKVK